MCLQGKQTDISEDLRFDVFPDSMTCLTEQSLPSWGEVVTEYCKRSLTNPRNKLLAISVIVEMYQQTQTERSGTYLANLWKKNLLEEMC